jgi:hypothetical protein
VAVSESYSGWDGEVLAGTWNASIIEWNADVEIKEIDTSTTTDAGWESATGGLKKVSGTFRFLYRTSPNNPTGSTAGISEGSTPTLTLYINKTLVPNDFLTGPCLITKLSFKQSVAGVGEVTASFRNRGAWIFPT